MKTTMMIKNVAAVACVGGHCGNAHFRYERP